MPTVSPNPAGIYLLKVNNSEMCKTLEQCVKYVQI